LKDKIEKYKNFDKRAKENNKKTKEDGPNWNHYYYHWKYKNHKLDLKDKIESHKNFNKKTKEKNKKLKVEGLNRKTLYIQIKIYGLNWKQIKL
jgi:hypothetical protein